MENIMLFGASKLGKIAFDYLKDDYNIVGFLDNDEKKWGKEFCGVKINSPQELCCHNDFVILICSEYHVYIAKQMMESGIRQFWVFNKEIEAFKIYKFDYTSINNFNVVKNKVALIIENNSGSSTNAILKESKEYKDLNLKLVPLYEHKKENNYYYELFTSSAIIRTHEGPYLDNKINIQLWHGFPLKGLSYMSKYANENKEYVHNQWSKIDNIISYSTLYNTLMSACYGIDCNKFEITGMPRNDLLFIDNGKEKLEKLLKRKIKEKIIFYMPTFRESLFGEKNGSSVGYMFNFKDYEINEFNKFLKENNLIYVIKLHPFDQANFYSAAYDNQTNIIFIQDSDLDINDDLYEMLNAVDILVTDYSSIYFDYILLDRPIIFIDSDREEYFENRGVLLEPYDFWTPGPKVSSICNLEKEILTSIKENNYYKSERNVICNMVHKFKDGFATRRILSKLEETLNK